MKLKILGTGCSKCNKLAELTQQAVTELGIDAKIKKIEDIQQIMQYQVMRMPALVIDEKVVISGELPSISKLKELLQ